MLTRADIIFKIDGRSNDRTDSSLNIFNPGILRKIIFIF